MSVSSAVPGSQKRSRLGWIALGLVGLAAVRACLPIRVQGHSMQPTLSDGNIVLAVRVPHGDSRLSQLLRRLLVRPGVIVILRPPHFQGAMHIKRVVWVRTPRRTPASMLSEIYLPADSAIFVAGDAAGEASVRCAVPIDSQLYGPCQSSSVIAVVLGRL